jgi:ABC-type antimicrobial peptide transport system, permease component
VPRHKIAIRTLLFAAEITIIGVGLGVGAGWAIETWVLSVIRERAPLPFWQTSFQPGLFTRAALLGLIVPLAASAFPVWRAIRVPPVEALLPPHHGREATGSHISCGVCSFPERSRCRHHCVASCAPQRARR